MRILIATPLSRGEAGGPAQYAANIASSLHRLGHEVTSIPFTCVRNYPSGVRHILYFIKICLTLRKIDAIIALDTYSVALPITCAAFFFRVPVVVRVGGDFLWESYIERTGYAVRLSDFYDKKRSYTFRERVIFFLHKWVILRYATAIVFSTKWQETLWSKPYGIGGRGVCIENAYCIQYAQEMRRAMPPTSHTILWCGRERVLKNVVTLRKAVELLKEKYPQVDLQICTHISHEEVLSRISGARMVVIPSYSEVSPNFAIEALNCGVPVIVTKDCGLQSTFPHSIVWVDSLQVEEVRAAIEWLLDEREYRSQRERVCAEKLDRTYDTIAWEFDTLLKKICS